jgi:hypothetical protein
LLRDDMSMICALLSSFMQIPAAVAMIWSARSIDSQAAQHG